MGPIEELIGWLTDPANWQGPSGVIVRVLEHLWLSALSLAVALLVALPIGLYVGHTGRGGTAAVNVAGIGRAIPSYALLILFFPIFGFGLVAPLLALVLLAIPPILANVYVGLRGVDREIVEAGRGMGMREREVLTGVELPAALPVIVAGTRSAAVAIVATATLAALIGGGGLGRLIVDGFALRDEGMLLAGALLVAVLAIAVERAFTLAERRLGPVRVHASTQGAVEPSIAAR
jgi:osmoprotectant transport system permease protein